jgi:hypothetical protein
VRALYLPSSRVRHASYVVEIPTIDFFSLVHEENITRLLDVLRLHRLGSVSALLLILMYELILTDFVTSTPKRDWSYKVHLLFSEFVFKSS